MTNCFSFSFACDCRRWFTPDGGACCRAARARIRRGARPNAAAATHATRCTCPCRRGSWSPRSTTRRRGGASAGTSSTCRDRRHMQWTTLVQLETKTTKGGPARCPSPMAASRDAGSVRPDQRRGPARARAWHWHWHQHRHRGVCHCALDRRVADRAETACEVPALPCAVPACVQRRRSACVAAPRIYR